MDLLGPLPQLHLHHLAGLVAASLLGASIGFERQWRGHPAGLHTDALVALGAAAYVIVGVLVTDSSGSARIAGQVVTGVGFLCAGVIMHQGATVRGINTAATVWCSAAVGLLAGFGMILWAAVATLFVVLTNVTLHYVENRLFKPFQDPGPSSN